MEKQQKENQDKKDDDALRRISINPLRHIYPVLFDETFHTHCISMTFTP